MELALALSSPRYLGTSPAAISIGPRRATLLLNPPRFDRLTAFAKRFVLAHELGHLVLSTSDECQADAFALGLLAGSEPESLRKSLQALLQLDIPAPRFESLCRRAIEIDQRKRNTEN